ncbi:MAG: cellulase family glycosylhydrolase [Ignavibacteriales bacterium]|nr:MAG: cellulase family glycosylhydrolase [Ignavibacteriales bacterium]
MKFYIKIFFVVALINVAGFSQSGDDLIFVDSQGRMKWSSGNEEAFFFGVNYSTPFAFSYRAIKNKNLSHKEIIDMDVQQFKRLGMNAYRIHVWDREVSDREGNLLNNEHIELLDYLIYKLIENDIYIILTPIAWWGTGWPEPDIETPGFSSFYSKIESTTKPEVLKAHFNYLKQFVNHKNSFTGKTYKDEKHIIAFEVFNEPNLPKDSDSVSNYVNATVKVLRDEGITKPIFFNISENPGKEQWIGVASSNIQGISFQWYPTGLVKYSELKGNYIPNVFSYPIPDYTDKINNKAKMVYEFDAADIGRSYMYPLMAHGFREAGMQWATMFAYDPTPLAQYNSEYSTHYLNLLYTPQKALSFLIGGQLFNQRKLAQKIFDNTSVKMENVFFDYENDLSVLNTSDKLYYSNSTNEQPIDVQQLKHIAGYGNSKVVKYDGRGTYFLDKIKDGLWKLELYPDAIWLRDPFGRNGLDEPAAKLIWKSHEMKISLPDLNPDFKVYSIENKSYSANEQTVMIEPGVYFITNDKKLSVDDIDESYTDFNFIKKYGEYIKDFHSTEIKNISPSSFDENEVKKISVEVYSPVEVQTFIYIKRTTWRGYQKFDMKKVNDFVYEFELPAELSSNGKLQYFICVNNGKDVLTFPGKLKHSPDYWSFDAKESYELSIFPASNKVLLFDPSSDNENIISPNIWRYVDHRLDYTFDDNNESEFNIDIRRVREKFPELAIQFYVGEHLKNYSPDSIDELELEIKKSVDGPDTISVRIIYNNTNGFERKIALNNKYQKVLIPLKKPEEFKYALLPRPYPTFLPYWYDSKPTTQSENLKPESIQIVIPLPGTNGEQENYSIKIKNIYLLKSHK